MLLVDNGSFSYEAYCCKFLRHEKDWILLRVLPTIENEPEWAAPSTVHLFCETNDAPV